MLTKDTRSIRVESDPIRPKLRNQNTNVPFDRSFLPRRKFTCYTIFKLLNSLHVKRWMNVNKGDINATLHEESLVNDKASKCGRKSPCSEKVRRESVQVRDSVSTSMVIVFDRISFIQTKN